MQGGVLWIGLNCIVIHLLTDIVYCFVDPRIRAMYAGKRKKAPVAAAKGEAGGNNG